MKILNNKKGFTLFELVVVIAIIGILTSIAIPAFADFQETAKNAVLENNTSEFEHIMSAYAMNYDKAHWYGAWNADNDLTLNNFMERNLETIVSGHFSNNSNYINPFSGKKSVLDYDKTLSSGDGYQPAVFMTNNSAFSLEGKGDTKNIIGTIVAYFHVTSGTTDYIDIYYVNKDGSKSDLVARIR